MQDGMHYITISQTDHMTQTTTYNIDDNTYTNKLAVSNVRSNDTGFYLCLGVNQNGYSYRKAYLNIVMTPMEAEFKLAITVLIPGLIVAVLLVCLVFFLKKSDRLKKYLTKLKTIFKSRNENALVMGDTNTISVSSTNTDSTYCNDYLIPDHCPYVDEKSVIYYKIIDPSAPNPNDSCLSTSSSSPSRFYYQVANNSSNDFSRIDAKNFV